MMMKPFSTIVYETLMTAGIERGRTAIREARGMKGRGAASDGALSRVETTDREGGQSQSPIGRQGGTQPMGNSGKGPAVNAPAKFQALMLVSSRCEPTQPQSERVCPPLGVGSHLMLVVSN
jgi:hypothetical protein